MNIQAKRILPQYFFIILLMSAKLFDEVSLFVVDYTWGLFLYLFQTKFSLIRMTHSHKSSSLNLGAGGDACVL